jgi:hypothetical protein
MKRKLADRLSWRQLYFGQIFAKMDQGACLYPLDQVNENAIEYTYLGFTEAINIGQEQVRHLP